MRLIFKEIWLPLILLSCCCFFLGCNDNAVAPQESVLLNQPNQTIAELTVTTSTAGNKLSDCNKPQNDTEKTICSAIIKDIDEEVLAELK